MSWVQGRVTVSSVVVAPTNHIVADGQFLNSWSWDSQALGSGSSRLGQEELDRREFARVVNPRAGPNGPDPGLMRPVWANLDPREFA